MRAAPKRSKPVPPAAKGRPATRRGGRTIRPSAPSPASPKPARKSSPPPAPKSSPKPAPARPAPAGAKTFALQWGKGVIEEEVQVATPHHVPAIQLLRFVDAEAAGRYEVRFCHYDHAGRFQRSPLILGERDLAALGRALAGTPKLRRLLAKLLA